MADQITTTEPETVHLVARDREGMIAAQADLTNWLKHKIESLNAEAKELRDAVAVAKQNNWKSGTLEGQLTKALKHHRFYTKTLLAVEAGLTIIPNFPIDVFAIRVTKEKPTPQYAEGTWSHPSVPDDKAQILPAGYGRYESPSQMVRHGSYKENEGGKEITKYFTQTTDFAEIAFPIIAARPEVMSATAQAMALQVFDQIGICPQSSKGDPMIIGQIMTGNSTWRDKRVSFLIAWYLDLRTL